MVVSSALGYVLGLKCVLAALFRVCFHNRIVHRFIKQLVHDKKMKEKGN